MFTARAGALLISASVLVGCSPNSFAVAAAPSLPADGAAEVLSVRAATGLPPELPSAEALRWSLVRNGATSVHVHRVARSADYRRLAVPTDAFAVNSMGADYVHGHGTRYSASHGESIYQIDDRTSDFTMLTDNGIHTVDMRRRADGTGCGGTKAGSYYYEHNQDGNGGWSASVSVGFFSISYSGSAGLTLRKAAKYNYYN